MDRQTLQAQIEEMKMMEATLLELMENTAGDYEGNLKAIGVAMAYSKVWNRIKEMEVAAEQMDEED